VYDVLKGKLIALEGIDGAGKETVAKLLARTFQAAGHKVMLIGFPDYQTEIGVQIGAALKGERDYSPQCLQLLMAANRWEWQTDIHRALADGTIVVSDRYMASGIAYGEAQGLEGPWLRALTLDLAYPDLTILLDIDSTTAMERKRHTHRDVLESDRELLDRARRTYIRLADDPAWVTVNAMAPLDIVKPRVLDAVNAFTGRIA
jgi:dTMP kinase